jgi:hypothetical protein
LFRLWNTQFRYLYKKIKNNLIKMFRERILVSRMLLTWSKLWRSQCKRPWVSYCKYEI